MYRGSLRRRIAVSRVLQLSLDKGEQAMLIQCS